jgi:hypothetical protein
MGLWDYISDKWNNGPGQIYNGGLQVADNLLHTNMSGHSAASQAENAQNNATNAANATQRSQYDQNREDLAPWRAAGMGALAGLGSTDATGKFTVNPDFQKNFTAADMQADPGYQFRMQQGQNAIERSAAARGSLNSGATLKALTDYGQNMGSQEYQNAYNRFNNDQSNRFNRLSSIAGIGQTANSQVVNAGENYANQVSGNQIAMGNARSANQIAGANQQSNTLGQIGSIVALASDERAKTNIQPISQTDLSEMKSHLKAFRFNYKEDKFGSGDWIGVMAQDLQKSKLGKTLVFEDSDGVLKVDMKKAISFILATMAEA